MNRKITWSLTLTVTKIASGGAAVSYIFFANSFHSRCSSGVNSYMINLQIITKNSAQNKINIEVYDSAYWVHSPGGVPVRG